MSRKKKPIDAVRVQFSVAVRLKRGKKLAPEAIEMLIKRWIQGERLPRGVKINAVVWQNPDRMRTDDRDWRGAGSRADITRLLHGKEFRHVHQTVEEARPSLAAITSTQSISVQTLGGSR